MPYRVNSRVPALFAGSLVAATLIGPSWAASAARRCIERPDREVNQAGHWYYHVNRENHRRCWFFEASEPTVNPAPATDGLPAPNTDSTESWFSRFATDVAKTFSPEPRQNSVMSFSSESPQNGISDSTSTAAKTTSSKRPRSGRIAKRAPSQIAPLPTTNGLASAEGSDQSSSQRTTEKDEKHTPQLTPAERQALFDDFLKWYMDKSVFGPGR